MIRFFSSAPTCVVSSLVFFDTTAIGAWVAFTGMALARTVWADSGEAHVVFHSDRFRNCFHSNLRPNLFSILAVS